MNFQLSKFGILGTINLYIIYLVEKKKKKKKKKKKEKHLNE